MRKLLTLLLALVLTATAALAKTELTWYGHAAFRLVTPSGKVLLIDPWISNPLNKNAPADLAALDKVDLILISHGHADHIGDAVAIAKKTNARLVTPFDLGGAMAKYMGYPGNLVGMETQGNIGGELVLLDGEVTIQFTAANHGSNLTDEAGEIHPGGNPCGFLIKIKNGPTVYHTGDTGLVSEMGFLAGQKVDVMLCCIGSHFVMSPAQAAQAVQLVKPAQVIPMHFQTFPLLTGTAEAFKDELSKAKATAKLNVLKVGQTIAF